MMRNIELWEVSATEKAGLKESGKQVESLLKEVALLKRAEWGQRISLERKAQAMARVAL